MSNLPFPIVASQTDAKSPIDQQLMDAIRLNLDYIDGVISEPSGGGGLFNFRVNGHLKVIARGLSAGSGKRLDGALVNGPTELTKATLYLEKGGTAGKVVVDVDRVLSLNHPIQKITSQYEGTTQAIGRVGSALNTQAIDLATPTINTQSISKPKGAVNIVSISKIADGKVLVVFSGTTVLDTDYEIGDSILFSGCDNALNNGEFEILNVNYNGLPSVVILNNSAVGQTTDNGTGELALFQFEYLASVSASFVAGQNAVLVGHTDAINNGTKEIYKINDAGNNIIFKYTGGLVQAGVAGSAQVTVFAYTFDIAPDNTLYLIGEKALLAGHTNALNDGKFLIIGIDVGLNKLFFSNDTGVVQAGASGTNVSLRFAYSTQSDSSTDILAGDVVRFSGHDNASNDGDFEIKVVNRSANSLELYNENGVDQAGANGAHVTEKKVVWFFEDLSASYTIDASKVLLEGLNNGLFPVDEFNVVENNRGGFSNYNIVVLGLDLPTQDIEAGRVATEAQSIFETLPKLEVSQTNVVRNLQYSTNGTYKVNAVPFEAMLVMNITEIQDGSPKNLVLSLS